MEYVLVVRNWDKSFEKAQTRKMAKALSWVAMPTKHDGKGYRRLMRRENGTALMGAFMLIVELAAKCPARGVLADEDGPFTLEDISDTTLVPVSILVEVVDLCIHRSMRWLQICEHPTLVEVSEHDRSALLLQYPTGQDRTGQDRTGQDRTGQDRTGHNEYETREREDGKNEIQEAHGSTQLVDTDETLGATYPHEIPDAPPPTDWSDFSAIIAWFRAGREEMQCFNEVTLANFIRGISDLKAREWVMKNAYDTLINSHNFPDMPIHVLRAALRRFESNGGQDTGKGSFGPQSASRAQESRIKDQSKRMRERLAERRRRDEGKAEDQKSQ